MSRDKRITIGLLIVTSREERKKKGTTDLSNLSSIDLRDRDEENNVVNDYRCFLRLLWSIIEHYLIVVPFLAVR